MFWGWWSRPDCELGSRATPIWAQRDVGAGPCSVSLPLENRANNCSSGLDAYRKRAALRYEQRRGLLLNSRETSVLAHSSPIYGAGAGQISPALM